MFPWEVCFPFYTEKTGICFPANLIRAYGEFFYGKHNSVFKENRKMFSLEFITKKTEICFLGKLGNSENLFRWKTEICFLLTYELEICKAFTFALFLRMEQHVMTSIVNEYHACTLIDMNVMDQSISYVTRYTATHRIITIDIGCEVSGSITPFTIVIQGKSCNLVHVSNDGK
jgi:hypothetical protein